MNAPRRLAEGLLEGCMRWGGARVAVSAGAEAMSYAALEDTVLRHAADAEAGVRCLFVPAATPASLAALYGLLCGGQAVALADPAWSPEVLRHAARACGCGSVVASERALLQRLAGRGQLAEPWHGQWRLRRQPRGGPALHAGTAVLRFGAPCAGPCRALEFSDTAVLLAADIWRAAAGLDSGDRVLCLAPPGSGAAFDTCLLPVFRAGASLHLHAGALSPRAAVRLLHEVRPTVLVALPATFELLLGCEAQLRSAFAGVRLIVSPAPLAQGGTAQRWERAAGIPVGHYLGLAETGPATFNPGGVEWGCGRALPGVELRCDGTAAWPAPLWIRTPWQATACLEDGGAPLAAMRDAAGFVDSGERGCLDEEGCLFLAGRSGRVASVAGRKVVLEEIEAALARAPGVRDVHVHNGYGFLTAFYSGEGVSPDAVRAACQQLLPALQVPHRLVQARRLPRLASGEVNLAALKASLP